MRKATRDLNNLLAGMGTPMEKIEALQKRNQELLGEMKKLEREYIKVKKRSDQLQKERDTSRSELNRTTGLKEKMEKVARDFTKDNKKIRVRLIVRLMGIWPDILYRMTSGVSKKQKSEAGNKRARDTKLCSVTSTA